MRKVVLLILLVILTVPMWPIIAMAGLFDDTEKLKGHYIAGVAQLEQLDCPIGGKYNCISWPQNLYRFGFDSCYQIIGYYGGFSRAKALLAISEAKSVSIFVIEQGIGEPKLKQYSVTSYKCPDTY